MEVNGVGNILSDVEGEGISSQQKKKKNSYITIERGL
jgi:hypothetical protein